MKKKYTYTILATDIVLFTIQNNELQVLLIQMKKEPYAGKWAMPGGLVSADESVDAAAERILKEKAGIQDTPLLQLHTFGDLDRDPFGRVVSVAYMALLQSDAIELVTTDEYSDVSWYAVENVPDLAYDHNKMLAFSIQELQARIEHTSIVKSLMPEQFTLTELQQTYEIILKKTVDKRNFRKKILLEGVLEETGEKRTGVANRPALQYRFV